MIAMKGREPLWPSVAVGSTVSEPDAPSGLSIVRQAFVPGGDQRWREVMTSAVRPRGGLQKSAVLFSQSFTNKLVKPKWQPPRAEEIGQCGRAKNCSSLNGHLRLAPKAGQQ
ncbi:hypothetical protein VZT92_018712 [Zoarces viviparus]|uniref:Uncharacterized protein n=1 Tax=Zoarces viviparus TaxID=48416 RepID=A0AAW1EJC1_ZOAVI